MVNLSFFSSNKTIKQFVKYFIIVLLIFLFIPYISISIYNHPVADDYSFYNESIRLGLIDHCISFYNTWSGRYSFLPIIHLLSQFNLLRVVKVLPIIFIALNLHATYYLFKSFNYIYISSYKSLLASFLLNFIFYSTMPTLPMGIYWFSGITTYFLSWILSTYFISIILRSDTKKVVRLQKLALTVLVIASIGLNEGALVFINLVLIINFLFNIKRFAKDKFYILLIITSIFFSIISVIAPGNTNRITSETNTLAYETSPLQKGNLNLSIKNSFSQFINYIESYWPTYLFIILAICVIVSFSKPILYNKDFVKKFVSRNLVIFFSLPVVSFPAYWATNYFQPRFGNYFYYIIILVCTISCISIITFYYRYIRRFRIYYIIFFFAFSIFYSQNMLFHVNNFKIATYDFVKGRAKKYSLSLDNRYRRFTKDKDFEVSKLEIISPSLYVGDITEDSSNWINRSTSHYFKLKSIRLKTNKGL